MVCGCIKLRLRIPMWGYERSYIRDVEEGLRVTNPHVGL